MRLSLLCLFLILSPLHDGLAQILPVADPVETYLRLLPKTESQVPPSFALRPIDYSSWPSDSLLKSPHPWRNRTLLRHFNRENRFEYALTNPELISTWNSNYPFGQNDGAMWQGRGSNFALSAGGNVRYGPLEIVFRPQIGYSQNSDFDLSPVPPRRSPFGFPFPHVQAADVPQRFGEEPISWFHPGQSTIRLHQWGIMAGFSTANIWIGPALNNPLILSNNAPGFQHFFLGSSRPIATPIGSFETFIYWGGLRESDWFDSNPDNDLRFTTGLLFAYSPVFMPGFTLGATRTHYEYYPEDGIGFINLTRTLEPRFTGRTDRIPTTQMLTLFGRWTFPEYGLEFWFDWGLNDGRQNSRSIALIPEHSRAYNLGLLKRFNIPGNRWLVINFEMTQLEHDRTLHSRSAASALWYEHANRHQGWTHLGQILGAGIGIGSNNQILRADLYDHWGLAGISFNRVELHNDKLRRNFSAISAVQTTDQSFTQTDLQNTEFRFGLHTLLFLPHNLELQADLLQTRSVNRYHILGNHAWNTHLSMTLRYQLPGGLR